MITDSGCYALYYTFATSCRIWLSKIQKAYMPQKAIIKKLRIRKSKIQRTHRDEYRMINRKNKNLTARDIDSIIIIVKSHKSLKNVLLKMVNITVKLTGLKGLYRWQFTKISKGKENLECHHRNFWY